MQNWNPMEESYNDPEFNRYSAGLGRDLSESRNIELYVQNIPPDFGQDGFYNLFAEFGKVVKARIVNSSNSNYPGNYGFVTMENIIEAKSAISKLDNKKMGNQFVLKVKLALTKDEKEQRRRFKQGPALSNQSDERDEVSQTVRNSGPWKTRKSQEGSERFPSQTENSPSVCFGRGMSAREQKNMRRREDNSFSESSIGRGRGFIKQPDSGTITSLSENSCSEATRGMRKSPLSQHEKLHTSQINTIATKNPITAEKKICNYCRKIACKNICSMCKQYYCSAECQKKDWPLHKIACQKKARIFKEHGLADEHTQVPGDEKEDLQVPKFGLKKNCGDRLTGGVRLDGHSSVEKQDGCKENQFDDRKFDKDNRSNDDSCDTYRSHDGDQDYGLKELQMVLPQGTQAKVMLTYFKDPSEFYLSLEEHLTLFYELSEMLKDLGNDTKNQVSKPRLKCLYAAKFEGEWCRARVEEIKGTEVVVYYIDYGNTDKVKICDLRLLLKETVAFPPQAIQCCLNGVQPKGSSQWSFEAGTFMQEWLGAPMTKFVDCHVIYTSDILHKVSMSHDGEDLGEKLMKLGLAETCQPAKSSQNVAMNNINKVGIKLKEKQQAKGSKPVVTKDKSKVEPTFKEQPAQALKRIMASDLPSEKQTLENGEKLKVIITKLVSAGEVYALRTEAYKTLSKMNAVLNLEYSKKSAPYRPVQGELVVIQFPEDNAWYRCEVVSIKGDDYLVHFLDFGNKEMVREQSIHQVTNPTLAEYPTLALKCKLTGLDSFTNITVDAMKEQFSILITEYFDSKGALTMLIKNKEDLAVDFMSESGVLFSKQLNTKLKEMSPKDESKQKQTSSQAQHHSSKAEAPGLNMEFLCLRENTLVNLCYILSTKEFYVRLDSNHQQFLNMMKELNTTIQSAPVMSTPCVGSLVAIQYSHDNIWYRGRVQEIQGNACKVVFLDYGNVAVIGLAHLRELSIDLTWLPVQAIRCSLNLKTQGLVDEEQFKDLLENEVVTVRAIKKSQETFIVNVRAPDHIKVPLLKDMSIDQPCVEQEIANLDFPISSTIKVECVNMDSPSRFYVQSTEHVLALNEAMLKMNKRLASKPDPFYSVSVGCFAAAKSNFDHDANWYRVSVESINGDSCSVYFVDYGIIEETCVSGLMRLCDEDLMLPACTIICRLNGCQTNMPDLDKSFSTLGPNLIDSVRIVEKEDKIFIVDAFDCFGKCITSTFLFSQLQASPVAKFQPAASSSPVNTESRKFKHRELPSLNQPVPATITHIESYSDLFVCLRDEALTSGFLHMMTKLNQDVDTFKPLRNAAVGSVCVAMFSQDNTWYRAQILEIGSPCRGMVQFVDYGNSEVTDLSQLRALPMKFMDLPAQAIPCCVLGFESPEPAGLSADMLHKVKAKLLERPCYITVVKKLKDKCVVIVENEQQESVFDNLLSPACSLLTPQLNLPKVSDILFETPTEKQFTALFWHINDLYDFYCQKLNMQELLELDSLSNALKADSCKPECQNSCEPVVGCVYMSKFKGSWYRCLVQEVRGSEVLIKYIDYGNTEVRSCRDLYLLVPERMSLPVRLIKCKLYGVKPVGGSWDTPDVHKYQEALTTEQPLLVIHEEAGDSFLVSVIIGKDVLKVNIAKDLVERGLARHFDGICAGKQSSPSQQEPISSSSEDEDLEEQVLKEQIFELQRKLKLAKQKKRSN